MFYSQFILAKKGPLGTIWIAAHLERKLRKNQVADTDIGVSVDSILFPEVPIALRLSSHLLLGVVRIYSRKVNYLFDDCSEALLKIKQAFRSTAVDLPPEESTAPYHSITLPETFDLDDFELPDNDILQGNYVDHHISTREQITLQDTMEGVVYSTSQFGLDERFGDGDTSQTGLELEEDLFLDKVAAPVLADVSEADPQASVKAIACPEQQTSHDGMTFPDAMTENGSREKVECQATSSEFIDYAQAPSTPGLVEEPNLSSVQKGLVCDDHLETEDHNLTEVMGIGSSENASIKSDLYKKDVMDVSLGSHMSHGSIFCMPSTENGYVSGEIEISQAMVHEDLQSGRPTMRNMPADGTACLYDKIEDTNNAAECVNLLSVASEAQTNSSCKASLEVRLQKTEDELVSNMEEPHSHSLDKAVALDAVSPLELPDASELVVEPQPCQGSEDPENLNSHVDNKQMTSSCMHVLRACNSSHLQSDASFHGVGDSAFPELQTEDTVPSLLGPSGREEVFRASETSSKVQGEEFATNAGMQTVENQVLEPSIPGEIEEDGRQVEPLKTAADQFENMHSSLTCDLPAPEKLLSAPEMLLNNPDDLLVDTTPGKEFSGVADGSISGAKTSGRKRTFTESALTVQSVESMESFGVTKSKRTVESVPDDDDLLSSILVGRRSSTLKIKSTPPAFEAASMKRTRTAPRAGALKRKVLMDDSMVLLGETIRQQLTSTEDIRRFRKKAPCTYTEIFMIQRQFLEGEIFSEPVLTGMSAELVCLHKETFDLSSIKIAETGDNNASVEVVKDKEFFPGLSVAQYHDIEGSIEPVICRNDGQDSVFPVQSVNKLGEDHHFGSSDIGNPGQVDAAANIGTNQGQVNAAANNSGPRSSEHERLEEISEMEVDRRNGEVANATVYNDALGFETSQPEPVSEYINFPGGPVDRLGLPNEIICSDTPLLKDAPSLSSDKKDMQLVEEGALTEDLTSGKGPDGTNGLDRTDLIVSVGNELMTGEGLVFEESKLGESVEIRDDVFGDVSVPTGDVDASLANAYLESGGCTSLTSVNVDQPAEDIENDKVAVDDEDRRDDVGLGHDEKDQTSSHLCYDECKMDSTYSVGFDEDFKNASLNDDFPGFQEADQQRAMDAEIVSLEHVVPRDSGDFQDAEFANDTGFLNVDDDEVDEDDDGMPAAEDTHLLDNSGWSSRTRAVAKYLQTLFDMEDERGRKVLLMDNLLAGKTRKEASRMFFETLVLKTRDYIHVEQVKPFDNIGIRPRAKLLKSDF